jgi:RimJ/RimL family protein N-acetyltransferase
MNRRAVYDDWVEKHTVHTPRLVLRPLRADDRRAFLRSIDEDVLYWQGYPGTMVRTYRRTFRAMSRVLCRPGFCPLWFAVDVDGRFAGQYSLNEALPEPHEVDIGWWLDPAARGLGLGTESLVAVVGFLHAHCGFPAVRMGTDARNVRARRQIEGAGAEPVEEGPHTLPDGRVVQGRWYRHVAPVPAPPTLDGCAQALLRAVRAVSTRERNWDPVNRPDPSAGPGPMAGSAR